MSEAEQSAENERYTDFAYPGKTYPFAHPDRLFALGRLHGLDPPLVQTARILELGCGDAINLLSIANQLPQADCVGIDLCDEWLVRPRRCASEVGLSNLKLITGDLADLESSELGTFDYIIAHGLFSWVPEPIRARLMAIIGECLTDRGLAMVSYNTYPGWHMRNVGRAIMQWHAEDYDDPAESVRAGRMMLQFMSDTLETNTAVYPRVLRDLMEFLEPCSDAYLYHDILAPVCEPIYFKDFAALAGGKGLQYACESNYGDVIISAFPQPFQETLRKTRDPVRREQLIDLMRNTMFRRSILCRTGTRVARSAKPERLPGMWVTMSGSYSGASENGEHRYQTRDERDVTVFDPLVHSALQLVANSRPRAVEFTELYASARLLMSETGHTSETSQEEFGQLLLQLYAGELVDLYGRDRPVRVAAELHPTANRLAQWELREGDEAVTNMLHERVELGRLESILLTACDGRSTAEDIAEVAVVEALAGRLAVNLGGQRTHDETAIRQAIEVAVPEVLAKLTGIGLLEPPMVTD